MNLSAPNRNTFIVAVVLVVIGLLASLIPLGFLTDIASWLILLGFVVLAAGVLSPSL
ncbi:MAG: hypothetical protein ACRDHL_12405 [Candidatus Promineifilaceae bacterium]